MPKVQTFETFAIICSQQIGKQVIHLWRVLFWLKNEFKNEFNYTASAAVSIANPLTFDDENLLFSSIGFRWGARLSRSKQKSIL